MTWAVAAAAAAVIAALIVVPRLLISRAQDRLAAKIVDEGGPVLKLLTRAEMVAGRYRRLPGVLAFREDQLEFMSLHGDQCLIPMARVEKISTGRRLTNRRVLFRQEVLRLTRHGAEEVEFVLSPASAHAWRSHLGLWAGRERENAAKSERVSPGRT